MIALKLSKDSNKVEDSTTSTQRRRDKRGNNYGAVCKVCARDRRT